ncbi:MAG: sugar ABC transporter ATP-binding protein [Candidatus Melainabacteria bacterium GWF2_37_15]|nr:MAG: sugar ABC transporter ATP-binding protein [Candidatus Melainabacteria bacterium GWF2_37_15]
MAGLILKNVNKIYDKKTHVIENLNLEIFDGEFLVLVGPSGCGKSTILRMIAGLEDINSGEILIDNKIVNNTPPKDRDIAMVFQNYALYPHMTVYQNMAFGLKMRKFKKDVIDKRVKESAEILDLGELLDRKPKQLSGGQRQRVALGRAIVREPKVFLMDEPLSNLDAKLRVQTRFELKKLHKRLGATFIYVTHDQVEAMTMGDRIVILDKGVVQQVGTPDEVYHYPANMFVAGFIGSPAMNFLDAGIIGKQGTLGIRPEYFTVGEAGTHVFKVVPELVETLGSEKLVHFVISDKKVTAKVPSEVDIVPGREVVFSVDESKVILF